MGAQDKDKSGGVVTFDPRDKDPKNHDENQVWHQHLRCYVSQNLPPELVHVLFSTQIDGTQENWGPGCYLSPFVGRLSG